MAQGPFHGIAGSLAGAFGGPVTINGGDPVTAIFRQKPHTVPGEHGVEILTTMPILRVDRAIAATINAGDVIDPDDGHTYSVLYPADEPENPAADALITFHLEELT